jgi:hypothetical protein
VRLERASNDLRGPWAKRRLSNKKFRRRVDPDMQRGKRKLMISGRSAAVCGWSIYRVYIFSEAPKSTSRRVVFGFIRGLILLILIARLRRLTPQHVARSRTQVSAGRRSGTSLLAAYSKCFGSAREGARAFIRTCAPVAHSRQLPPRTSSTAQARRPEEGLRCKEVTCVVCNLPRRLLLHD